MIERVVVNPEGVSIRLELMPPFSYLHHVTQRVQNGGKRVVGEKTNASTKAGECSDYVPSGVPGGIRTPDFLLRRQEL